MESNQQLEMSLRTLIGELKDERAQFSSSKWDALAKDIERLITRVNGNGQQGLSQDVIELRRDVEHVRGTVEWNTGRIDGISKWIMATLTTAVFALIGAIGAMAMVLLERR